LTGLYNETYIRQRLDEEIKRAIVYQRPCALALFIVEGLNQMKNRRGPQEAEQALKKVARVIQESVTEIDRVGRLNGDRFAVVLPERNKRQAMELFEEIRRRVEFVFAQLSDPADRLSVYGSVAENPLDGVTAEDLLSKSAASASNGSGCSHEGTVAYCCGWWWSGERPTCT
jgi:diguanylate cyclase (GGDEF)-like protein